MNAKSVGIIGIGRVGLPLALSLNKNGVVKKDEYIEEVINKIKDFMKAIKWQVIGIKNSPIRGRSGNKEFLLYASKGK